LQNVQPAAAAIALQRIARIGNQLQLTKNELWSDHNAIQESRLRNIGDSAIDDHAGIQDFVAFLELFLTTEDAAKCGQIQEVALVRADDQPDIRHQQHDHDLEEAAQRSIDQAVMNDQCEQVSANDAEDASDRRPDQPLQADPQQPPLEKHNCDSEAGAYGGINLRS
jgi:hypothetical protein